MIKIASPKENRRVCAHHIVTMLSLHCRPPHPVPAVPYAVRLRTMSLIPGNPDLDENSSQMSDGEPWGWFDEMDDVGVIGNGSHPHIPPVTKATPPYILTVRFLLVRVSFHCSGLGPTRETIFEKIGCESFGVAKLKLKSL